MTPVQMVSLIVIALSAPGALALAGCVVLAVLREDRGHHARAVGQDGAHRRGLPVDDTTQPYYVVAYVARGGALARRSS